MLCAFGMHGTDRTQMAGREEKAQVTDNQAVIISVFVHDLWSSFLATAT